MRRGQLPVLRGDLVGGGTKSFTESAGGHNSFDRHSQRIAQNQGERGQRMVVKLGW